MDEASQPVIMSGAAPRAQAGAGRSSDAPFHDNALPTHRLRPQKLEVLRLRFARLSACAPLRMTAFFLAALALSARAQTPDKPNNSDHVLPIFRNACLNCHNPDKKKAGLDLSTYQGALQGSENGKVLRSGDGSGSLLLKCVMQTEDPKMPPKGDKLSDGEIAIVRKWIDGQLLETAGGKAVAVAANNVQVAVVSLTRPEGPPPMPRELPLDPVVHTAKANSLTALGASPWAPLVALGGQKQIVLFNTETLEPLGVLPFPEGFPTIIRFSRNGQLILTGGGRGGKSGKVVIWKVETGERIAAVGQEFDQVLAADLSADQQFVALGGPAKLVKIYATKDGRLIHSIKKHTDWVTALSFSPDGKLLASGARHGGVIVWEAAKGKEFNVLAGHKGAVTGVSFMTGVVASASEDATIKLWDANLGREIKSWSGHKGGVQSVAFSPDGRLVSSGRDKIVRVWDQAGKQLMASEAFGDIALRAELAGERVIGGDWSGQVRVWSLDGKRVGELSANPPPIAERIAVAEKQLAEAQSSVGELQKELAAAEAKSKADLAAREEKLKAARAADEAKLKAELAPAEAALAKARAEPLDKIAAAEKAVQEITARLTALQQTPIAPRTKPADSSAAQEIAKAKAGIEQSQARVAAAQASLDKWRAAQVLQGVHNARQLVAEKQAAYDSSVQAAKDAPLAVERARSDLAAAQKARWQALMWPDGKLSSAVIGQSATVVAQRAGLLEVAALQPRVLLVEESGTGEDYPFSGEKLCPVLTLYRVPDFESAMGTVERIYAFQGAGHSVGLHSARSERALALGLRLPVSRVIVDQAHCIATGGSFDNGLPFSLSMGCGTWGKNNFSDNMNYRHYLNITRISRPIPERMPSEEQLLADYFAKYGRA